MESLIPIINKLQDVFAALNVPPLKLPQLVVVGSQSAGKSSVLENIVGRDFLPRGSNIVTRRPLILQLVNTLHLAASDDDQKDLDSNGSSSSPSSPSSSASSSPSGVPTANNGATEWGEFLHRKNEQFSDFEKIREEIMRETDRLVGKNKGVSSKPITLKIFSPRVLNITLVDLPGITKVPVGDQPSDIEMQIRNMIMEYIAEPNSIVVAVSPANSDIANSDALKLAREVDPHGVRTLGVITKIDLMDKGTDAMDVLVGKVIPLQHGFVGIVNRSQQDINQKKSIHQSLKSEKQFFATHPVYRSIAYRMGTPYLAKRLNSILMHHIQDCLPDIRAKIGATINETQQELESYGNPILNNPNNLGPLLLHLLSKYCNAYRDALDGKSPEVSTTELYGGARISYVFHDIFAYQLENINPFDILSEHDIRTAIRNATGPRPALFIPEVSFELLVKRQIERLLSPALQCVDMVFDELKRVASQCESLTAELVRFPVLRERISACVRELLVRRIGPTKEMITNLINIELAYINTNHPNFIGGSRAVQELHERMNEQGGLASLVANAQTQHHQHQHQNQHQHQSQTHSQASNQDDAKHQGSPLGVDQRLASRHKPLSHSPLASSVAASASASSASSSSSSGLFNMLWGRKHKEAEAQALGVPKPSLSSSLSSSPGAPSLSLSSSAALRPHDFAPGMEEYGSSSEMSLPHAPEPGLQILLKPPTHREIVETQIIKSLIQSYFGIVRSNVQDSIPKAIMFFLVNHIKKDIQSELVKSLYKEPMFEVLLKEAEDVSEKRGNCVELLEILQKALDIVNQVRDYSALQS